MYIHQRKIKPKIRIKIYKGGGCKQVYSLQRNQSTLCCSFYDVVSQVVDGVFELHTVRPFTTSAPSWCRSKC